MKRIFAIILTLILAVGCVGCKPNAPQTPTPEAYITGLMLHRGNDIFMITKDRNVIHLTLNTPDEVSYPDFSYVKAGTSVLKETYPAKGVAYEIKEAENILTAEEINEFKPAFDSLCELGYADQSEWPFDNTQSSITAQLSFDKITPIVDKLAENEPNVLFSPLSLDIALGIVSNGVDEDFVLDFENHFGMTIEEYNDFVQNYIKTCQPENSSTTMTIANAVWVREGFTLDPSFENEVNSHYDASANSRKFDMNFVNEVNQWCADKTNNMIDKILEEAPNPDTASIVTSALYFDADWQDQYDEYQVSEMEFKNSNGEISKVDGLHEMVSMDYLENDQATGFMKYYADERYAFVGILPKAESFTLSSLNIDTLMNSKINRMVSTSIPKFSYANANDLTTVLPDVSLDVTKYTLGYMVIEDVLKISKVFQNTAINVTESGTTAAAVTTIAMDTMGLFEEPTEVILNRPFAFMIYDTKANLPLFIGKVTNI